jgi:tetratricopeptide (TPR) repeat protein
VSSRVIKSCIVTLYVSAAAGALGAIPAFDARIALQVAAGDPEAHYRDRENLASAKAAADIWAARLAANNRDFESAYKLAQARYWLGTNGLPEPERKLALEGGIAAARTAIAITPSRPEGHFWLAANMGALAESFGMRQGIRYRGQIKDALLMTLKLDPAFLDGSADRALGRWYFKVPGMFGGSNKQSEIHLRKSLTYNRNSVISHLFLAETLADMGRKDEARKECQAAIDAPPDPNWAPEDRRFKEIAKRLLRDLQR